MSARYCKKTQSIFGLWNDISATQINRLLEPYGIKMIVKLGRWHPIRGREGGDQVTVSIRELIDPNIKFKP